jgi:CheY-like chemotaxis protein
MLADRMASLGTLVAGIAHEINNPLSFILSNLSYIGDLVQRLLPVLEDVEQQDLLEAVSEATEGAQRVQQIVKGLKSSTRGDDDKIVPVELAPVIESALKTAHNEIRHRATLVRDLQPVGLVMGNEGRIYQVLVNLLINAAQATDAGVADKNQITVRTCRAGERIAVEITDTGCGMPPDVLARIFDPFFTTKPIGVGTGLGLSICHGIISALGGEIEVRSVQGEGSVFRVLLLPAPQKDDAPAAAPAAPAARLGLKVMVVDDETGIVNGVRRLLAPKHQVIAAKSAIEALQLLQRGEAPDVILCDVMMPHMTGPELLEALHQQHATLAGRLAFMTGGVFADQPAKLLSKYSNPTLEKPFSAEQLNVLIAHVAGNGP